MSTDIRRYQTIIERHLNELHGVKRFHDMNLDQMLTSLFPEGTEMKQYSGTYGKVFDNPKWNYVIKMWQKDDCYMDFVNFTIANPSNNYPRFVKKKMMLPVFFKREKRSYLNHVYFIRIERLQPIPRTMGEFLVNHLRGNVHHTQRYLDGEPPYSFGKDGTDMRGPDGETIHVRTVRDLWDQIPWLKDFDIAWHKLVTECPTECKTDEHPGNFMLRDDGTVVITDPFWVGDFGPYQWNARQEEADAIHDDPTSGMTRAERKAYHDARMVRGGRLWTSADQEREQAAKERDLQRGEDRDIIDDPPPF